MDSDPEEDANVLNLEEEDDEGLNDSEVEDAPSDDEDEDLGLEEPSKKVSPSKLPGAA